MHNNLAYHFFPVCFELSVSITLVIEFAQQKPHIHYVDQKSAVSWYECNVLSDFYVICPWAAPQIGISFAYTRNHFTHTILDLKAQLRPLVIIMCTSSFSFSLCNEEHFPMEKTSCHCHKTIEDYGILSNLIEITNVQCTTRCQNLQIM